MIYALDNGRIRVDRVMHGLQWSMTVNNGLSINVYDGRLCLEVIDGESLCNVQFWWFHWVRQHEEQRNLTGPGYGFLAAFVLVVSIWTCHVPTCHPQRWVQVHFAWNCLSPGRVVNGVTLAAAAFSACSLFCFRRPLRPSTASEFWRLASCS